MHVANRASAISANVGNVSFKQKTWLEHFLPLGSAHHNERSTVYDALKMNMIQSFQPQMLWVDVISYERDF